MKAIDRFGATALVYAAIGGQRDIAAALLDEGAAVDRVDGSARTALHHAAQRGGVEVARLLLERGADVDRQGGSLCKDSPLHQAANHAQPKVVELLLEKGAKRLAMNCDGLRPIETAKRAAQRAEAEEKADFDAVIELLDKDE